MKYFIVFIDKTEKTEKYEGNGKVLMFLFVEYFYFRYFSGLPLNVFENK